MLLVHAANSQKVYFRHYEVEDGLSNNAIIHALQDKKGFMWFGTPDGLNRYDGYHFKIFKTGLHKGALGSNAIFYLHEDAEGILWVGTEKGLYIYDEKLEQFNLLTNSLKKTIRAIEHDNNNNLYFAEGASLYVFNNENKKIEQLDYPGLKNITALARDSDGNIWAGCDTGRLIAYSPGKKTTRIYTITKTNHPFHTIEKILPLSDRRLMIGTSQEGLIIFNPETNASQHIVLNPDKSSLFVRDIIHANNNTYWVATENGLYIYNPDRNIVTRIEKNINDPYSISDNAVYSLVKDKEGGIWAGTYFGGINYFANPNIYFEKFYPVAGLNSLSGSVTREIAADSQGNLWIGTEDKGLNHYNPATNVFTSITSANNKHIASNNIHGLLADGNKLYIGTFEHGMYIMNITTHAITGHFEASDKNIPLNSNYINTFYKNADGTIFTCTSNGLYKFYPQSKKFTLFNALPPHAFYSAIAGDAQTGTWVGTHSDGIYNITPSNKIARLKLAIGGRDLLSETRILNFNISYNKNLWICTENGLYYIDLAAKKFILYNEQHGLPSGIVYAAVEDNLHNLWASTSKGLVRIDAATKKIKIFRKSDGLLSEQFNHHSSYIDKAGDIYFGSVKGLIKFNPGNYFESRYTPPLFATDFHIDYKDVSISSQHSPLNSSIVVNKKIVLTYKQSTFSIDFSALSYTSPDNIKYAYKLEGIDKDWNIMGNDRKIYFTNLAPGNYNLIVRSTNSSGLWSDNLKGISIEVTPPFWKSGIAYTLYLLACLALIYLITAFIIKRNKEKQQRKMELLSINKEKEIYKSKVDFFTNVAHEIKTPLSLIKAPLDKIQLGGNFSSTEVKYLEIMNRNTNRLLELTNQLLDLRKVESEHYELNFIKIDMQELLKTLLSDFQSIIEQKKIILQTHIKPDNYFVYADEDAIKKITSNLVDNAVKYCAGYISITLQKTGLQTIQLRFSNNGNTITEKDQEKLFEPFFRTRGSSKIAGTGIGLSMARSLALLNKGELKYFVADNLNIFMLTLTELPADAE